MKQKQQGYPGAGLTLELPLEVYAGLAAKVLCNGILDRPYDDAEPLY